MKSDVSNVHKQDLPQRWCLIIDDTVNRDSDLSLWPPLNLPRLDGTGILGSP